MGQDSSVGIEPISIRARGRARVGTATTFAAALDFIMAAQRHNSRSLLVAVGSVAVASNIDSLQNWRTAKRTPKKRQSFRLLGELEDQLHLKSGYLTGLAFNPFPTEQALRKVHRTQQATLRWHLPRDFDSRPEDERAKILAWASDNVLPCSTEYGKYQSKHAHVQYSIVFPELPRSVGGRVWSGSITRGKLAMGKNGGYGTIPAPRALAAEVAKLIAFKTAPIAPRGYRRYRQWAPQSAKVAVHRYGKLLGILAAAPLSPAGGLGVPLNKLTLGLLAFPSVWDWYLHWCERRRGFFAASEHCALYEAKALTRKSTGWLRQHPELARHLQPIRGLISSAEIERARKDWPAICDVGFQYACDRIAELSNVKRMHRDPFIAIMPVLSTKSPLREYVKIGVEILKWMPDESHEPHEYSLAVRSYLLFRLAIHLGIRQRNLRELLVCWPGQRYRSQRQLEELRRGEIRWNEETQEWQVFIPALAFKNRYSSFFKGRPFQLTLPDLHRLYHWIDRYLKIDRGRLLKEASDPGTFFVRNIIETSLHAPELDMSSFYSIWKGIVQRYGIFNPYTGRGAIKGLLPHGPHCVRDIIATHLLKQTGSYELASFAIQDSMETVMRHYARFLPHEKTARAAEELNKVWH